MAFDNNLAERIRQQLGAREGITEKKMFGGLAFLMNGNMCCGVHGRELIVRLDPERTDKVLAEPHTRVFDLTGRPMRGWIMVAPGGVETNEALDKWIRMGADYAGTLRKK